MTQVTLSGFIIAPNNDLENILRELPTHIQLTQQEPGCISFNVTQSDTHPNRFDVAEEFDSHKAFEFHQARVKSSHWGQITTNVKRHYTITEDPA